MNSSAAKKKKEEDGAEEVDRVLEAHTEEDPGREGCAHSLPPT